MSIWRPPLVDQLGWAVGMEWPEGDEDNMWALADAWRAAAKALNAIDAEIDDAIAATRVAYPQGTGGDSMITQLEQLRTGDSSIDTAVEWFGKIAGSADGTGNEIEYSKLMFHSTLVLLLAEIAAAWIFPPTAPAAEGIAIASTRVGVRILVRRLVAALSREGGKLVGAQTLKMMLRHFGLSIVLPTLQDAGIQAWQAQNGRRDGIDWTQVRNTAITSTAGAIVGLGVGVGAGALFRKPAAALTDKLGGKLGRAVPAAALGGIGGIGGGLGGWAANAALTGNWEFDPRILTAGGIGGALPTGVGVYREKPHGGANHAPHGDGENTRSAGTRETDAPNTERAGSPSETTTPGHDSPASIHENRAGDGSPSNEGAPGVHPQSEHPAAGLPQAVEPAHAGLPHADQPGAVDKPFSLTAESTTSAPAAATAHPGTGQPAAGQPASGQPAAVHPAASPHGPADTRPPTTTRQPDMAAPQQVSGTPGKSEGPVTRAAGLPGTIPDHEPAQPPVRARSTGIEPTGTEPTHAAAVDRGDTARAKASAEPIKETRPAPGRDGPTPERVDSPNSRRPSIYDAHADHGEQTPAGVAHHGGNSEIGNRPDRVPADPARFTADVHITEDGNVRIGEHVYSPEEYGDLLPHAGWDGKTPIRILGCDAGATEFAARLAAHTGVDVLGASKPVWTDNAGRVYASTIEEGPNGRHPRTPPDGTWDTHHPDGTRTRASDDAFPPGTPDEHRIGVGDDDPVERGRRFIPDEPVPIEDPTREPRATMVERINDEKYREKYYDGPDKNNKYFRKNAHEVDCLDEPVPIIEEHPGNPDHERFQPKSEDYTPSEYRTDVDEVEHRATSEQREAAQDLIDKRAAANERARQAEATYQHAKDTGTLTDEIQQERSDAHRERTEYGEELGEHAARDAVHDKYPASDYEVTALPDPTLHGPGMPTGDEPKSGRFDQIYKVENRETGEIRYVVVEAKGPHAGLGVRAGDGGRYEQGHPKYVDSVIANMKKYGTLAEKNLAFDLELAKNDEALDYMVARARVREELVLDEDGHPLPDPDNPGGFAKSPVYGGYNLKHFDLTI